MKRKIFFSAIILSGGLFLSSCSDFLDINQDPTAIASSDKEVPMSAQLAAIETEWALMNHGESVRYSQFWTLVRSYDGSILGAERGILTPSLCDIYWNPYVGALRNANSLYIYATEQNDACFKGISAIIMAQNWASLTDFFNDIPCSEAFQYPAILKPAFDTQEEVYTVVFNLLDEAITTLSAVSVSTVGTGDYIYSGDISKWIKLAYSLRARYNLRLWYRTGSAAKAASIVSDIDDGMASAEDEALFIHSEGSTSRSFWAYEEQADYSGMGFVASPFIVNMMKALNDPRIPIYFSPDANGGYTGWVQGQSSGTDNWPSHASMTRITDAYPETIMNVREALFIKAEAYILANDFVNGKAAFEDAVTYSMQAEGVSDIDITAYLAQFTFPGTQEAAQELIINQKYIAAFFTNVEPLFDYIRTGYPEFGDISLYIDNPGNSTTPPIRLYYPQIEEDRNPDNTVNADDIDIFSTKVWWDNK
jgi:hypothetical protein